MTRGRQYSARAVARAHTICVRRLSDTSVREGAWDTREYTAPIPRTWGECIERGLGTPSNPCVHMRCSHNLLVDVSDDTGSYKVTWPHLASGQYGDEYERLPEHTCALRVAEQGAMTLDEIGAMLNLTRERVRQIETKALLRLRALDELVRAVDDELDAHAIAGGISGDLDHHVWVGR